MFGPLVILILLLCDFTELHLPIDKSHVEKLQNLCEQAITCFHDKIPSCGKSVNEARTFLDLCDMYEYSCQHNIVFRHTKEDNDCPNERDIAG